MGAAPASACRLALLLAIDVSSSVDAREDRLQRGGISAALIAPEVRRAFLQGAPVALSVFEWSGRRQQYQVLPWRLIDSDGDLTAAADVIARSARIVSEYPTALGNALGHAAIQFRAAPACDLRTIDVSGDGRNNDGFAPHHAYRHFPFQGVTVNALAISADPDLVAYFESDVIRGPFAFVETARNYSDFERAMRLKLLRELEPKAIGALRRQIWQTGSKN